MPELFFYACINSFKIVKKHNANEKIIREIQEMLSIHYLLFKKKMINYLQSTKFICNEEGVA